MNSCTSVYLLRSCAVIRSTKTEAENESGYRYVPVDPFAMQIIPGDGSTEFPTAKAKKQGTLLQSLPGNAARMPIARFNSLDSVSYDPKKWERRGSFIELLLNISTQI